MKIMYTLFRIKIFYNGERMRHLTLFSILTVCLLMLVSCKKGEETTPAAPKTEAKPKIKKFTPDSEGKVSKEQVESWNKANPMLNQLILTYKDSLNSKDTLAYVEQKKSLVTELSISAPWGSEPPAQITHAATNAQTTASPH